MGLFDKLRNMLKDNPMSGWAREQDSRFFRGVCDICGAEFDWIEYLVVFPTPVSGYPRKPAAALLDLGGWCIKCKKMVCPAHADFVRWTHEGEDWWTTGHRDCQMPLGGKWNKEHFESGGEV